MGVRGCGQEVRKRATRGHQKAQTEVCATKKGPPKAGKRRGAALQENQRKSSWAKSVRLRRQTIQVCIPGVSMSACTIFLEASHLRKVRLMSMRRSSVPQAIQSNLIC